MGKDRAFARFPVLSTERLHLRQIQQRDAEALFAIKSNLDVTQQYGQEPHQSIDDTLDWIQRIQALYGPQEDIVWALTFKGEETLIGAATLWNIDPGFHCAELGYELHPTHSKKGLMTEAVSAILTFGFTELELHRIEANPLAKNTASKNLLHRLGFTYEGKLRQRHFFRGHFEDQLYYGILKDEWLKSKSDRGKSENEKRPASS